MEGDLEDGDLPASAGDVSVGAIDIGKVRQ